MNGDCLLGGQKAQTKGPITMKGPELKLLFVCVWVLCCFSRLLFSLHFLNSWVLGPDISWFS